MKENRLRSRNTQLAIYICWFYFLIFGALGQGLLPALNRSIQDTYSLSHTDLGLLISVASAAAAFAGMYGGLLCDRIGALKVMIWACGLVAFVAPFAALNAGVILFVVAYVVFNAVNGFSVAINPLGASLFGSEQVRRMNVLHGFQGVGRFLAPLILSLFLYLNLHWKDTFFLSAIVHLLCMLIFVALSRMKIVEQVLIDKATSLSERFAILKDRQLLYGVLAFFFCTAGESLITNWLPVMLEGEAQFSKAEALWCLSALMAGYTCIRLLPLFLKIELTHGVALIGVGTQIVLVALLSQHLSFTTCAFVSFIFGTTVGLCWPSTLTLIYSLAPKHHHGLLIGFAVVSSIAGVMVLNSLFGYLADMFSVSITLWMVPCAFLAHLALYNPRK